MPNKKGGKKFKKGKKNRYGDEKKQLIKRDPDESQEYAQVIAPKGNGRFELLCCDGGKTRMGTVCGQMRKRVWIQRSDLVLISLWEGMTDDTKCSIIHRYSEDEAKRLLKERELPENFKFNLDELDFDDDNGFMMELPSDSDESESDSESESESESSDKGAIDIDEI